MTPLDRRPMASRRLLSLLLCVVALGWLATTASAASKEKITLEFNDVDIKVVVKFISQLVHKNFIVDDAVKGKVTVISPVPVSADEAYEIFLSILDVKGFAAVPAGRVVKIIPAAEARAKRLPTVTVGAAKGPADDRVRTQLIQLEHVDASRVVPLLKPLIAKTSHVEAFASANTILITDVASNIDRILKIIQVIDTPGFQQQLAIIPLQYATADKLAGQISSIFGGGAKVAPRPARRGRTATTARTGLAETVVKVFADERTNSLIVFATKNDLAKVKHLVEQLDIAPPVDNSRVRIYRLQHAVAKDLADVLSGVESARAKGAQAGARRAARAAPRPGAARARGILGEGASIIPDEATNALIVTASPEEHASIAALIKQLDVQPLQVFVEALIVEVSMSSDFNLGIDWRVLAQSGSNGVAIGNATTTGNLDTVATLGSNPDTVLPKGLAIGFLGDTIQFNGVTIPSLGALVTALKTNGNSNIISTPQILTLNNKEAEFDSVTTLPFQTGNSATGSGTNVVSTFDFRDVGTKLRITPHINKEGYVRMEIHQEVANVDENASAPGLPVTSKRSADTVAVVKDGHTIVIGGLISNNMGISHSKVPLLGDIPFLGALFRSTGHSTNKTNLLVFITPHVIQHAEELRPFTERRSRENNLLQGKEFKGMMRETFPQGFPGIEGQGLGREAARSPAVRPAPVVEAPVQPQVATPPVTAAAGGAPQTAAPHATTSPPPPAATDLTTRLRSVLSTPVAEGATTAPVAPSPAAPVATPATASPAPSSSSSAPPAPPAEGDELMQRLHKILEEPAANPAATEATAPATTPSAAEELHLKEVEQPLFEQPKKRGWLGRTLDRIRGKGKAASSPKTTPDAVSPIYRYTPEAPSTPAADGGGNGAVGEK